MPIGQQTQIRLTPDGEWHRRSSVRGYEHTTACGELIVGPYLSRDAVIDEHICPRCHSRHEVDTGKLYKLERFDDDPTPVDPPKIFPEDDPNKPKT